MNNYEIFCRTLKNLNEIYKYDEPYKVIEAVGILELYRLCFDWACNMMKDVLKKYGYSERNVEHTKSILKTAYSAGMIEDEEVWLSALAARKNVYNTYNEAAALDIIRLVKERFYDIFAGLKAEIDNNWSE
ncbi:MAG: nucleotidyltransferase substrate binding protein [Clostridiales bacterium]|nr:nucleotidyltransferase substrate binding protein [Clostridiales bacterium]